MALAIRIGRRKAAGIDRVLGRLSDAAWVQKRPSALFPDLTYSYARPELQTTTFDELRGAGGLSLVRDEELQGDPQGEPVVFQNALPLEA